MFSKTNAKYDQDGKLVEPAVRPTLKCGPGRTKQSAKDETDINLLMAKYQKTGMINFVNSHKAEYMDADPIDFQLAMDTVVQANAMFDEMPSKMRKRFNNDPKTFYEFIHDPANEAEMYDLGLADRPPAPDPESEPATEPVPNPAP